MVEASMYSAEVVLIITTFPALGMLSLCNGVPLVPLASWVTWRMPSKLYLGRYGGSLFVLGCT